MQVLVTLIALDHEHDHNHHQSHHHHYTNHKFFLYISSGIVQCPTMMKIWHPLVAVPQLLLFSKPKPEQKATKAKRIGCLPPVVMNPRVVVEVPHPPVRAQVNTA